MKQRIVALALLPLVLAACDVATMNDLQQKIGMTPKVEESTEAAEAKPAGPPAVSPLVEPIEEAGSTGVAVATAEAETLNTAAFSARGNEPFWAVDVTDSTATYITPENQNGRKIPVRRINFASGVEYIGELNGQSFALTIRGTNCVDTMSGQKFPMTSSLRIGTRSNGGCAAPAGKMSKPEVATKAPEAPAATAAAVEEPAAPAAVSG